MHPGPFSQVTSASCDPSHACIRVSDGPDDSWYLLCVPVNLDIPEKSGTCTQGTAMRPKLEAARMANTAARLMEGTARAALTLDRLKNGNRQTVVVQYVTVADGGQAVVAGAMGPGGRRK